MAENNEVLQLFNGLKKSEIFLLAVNAFDTIQETGNFLQAAEALSAMENFIKQFKDNDQFKSYIRDEIVKYKGGYVSASGAKIEAIETGVNYDFSECGDVELELFESKLKSAESSVKERKEFLKKVPATGLDVVAPYTGELITIYPPTKTSQSSYKITLAK